MEFCLLHYITDKFKTGVIGTDWMEKDGRISRDVSSGKFETPDSALLDGMVKTSVKGGKK